jgi:N-acetylmuramoyl-L-alanine amidase
MESLSLFLWKSIVVSGLLTTWYLLALRGRRLHRYNRLFLLTTLFASLVIPFLHFELFTVSRTVTDSFAPVALFVQPAGDIANNLPVIPQSGQVHFSWQALVGAIAVCISLTLLLILLVRIVKVQRMRKRYPATQLNGVEVILTDAPGTPFTFLKHVFWNRSIPLHGEIGQLIFRHEVAHIQYGHTYDKLACQLLTCIFWFNPFYWLIQKELNIVHEFVADEHAVHNRDTEVFAKMVLQSYNNGSYLVPQHHFFSSTIKRRLSMLQNAAKPSHTLLRRFMALPLVVASVLLFSIGCHTGAAGDIVPAEKKIVVLLDAGHGGQDQGATVGSYIEKDICLKYARRIKELAPAYNVDVYLTREDDRFLPLADRVAISDKARQDLFISLHIEVEPGKDKAKGDFEMYIATKNTYAAQSSKYSTAIFGSMAEGGIIPGIAGAEKHDHNPGCTCSDCNANMLPAGKEFIYVLKNVHAPAVMMVLGNIKNQEGMKELTDDNRVDLLCHAVLKGIVKGSVEKVQVAGNPLDAAVYGSGSKCR